MKHGSTGAMLVPTVGATDTSYLSSSGGVNVTQRARLIKTTQEYINGKSDFTTTRIASMDRSTSRTTGPARARRRSLTASRHHARRDGNVIVIATLFGDADLDGVSINDFNLLAAGVTLGSRRRRGRELPIQPRVSCPSVDRLSAKTI